MSMSRSYRIADPSGTIEFVAKLPWRSVVARGKDAQGNRAPISIAMTGNKGVITSSLGAIYEIIFKDVPIVQSDLDAWRPPGLRRDPDPPDLNIAITDRDPPPPPPAAPMVDFSFSSHDVKNF